MWAILTSPDKKGGLWEKDVFFRTGVDEINELMRYLKETGHAVRKKRALDFGCGVGRLTQAMAPHFEEVCGIDIASSMIQLAEEHNRHPGVCRYILNERTDLRVFSDEYFDFIYSNLVLQHMRQEYSKKYIREFLRILSPEGILVFQSPHKQIRNFERVNAVTRLKGLIKKRSPSWVRRAYRAIVRRPEWDGRYSGEPVMEMHCLKKEHVLSVIRAGGGRVIAAVHSRAGDYESVRYCVTK